MPENNNNFNNDLPKMNNDYLDIPKFNNQESQIDSNDQKPLIEIPQKYYDQLAKEREEAEKKENEREEKYQEKIEASNALSKGFFMVTLTSIIIFALLYITINYTELAMLLIPIYIVIGSITSAIKQNKESSFPVTILVSGMIIAVVTFSLSMLYESQMELWTYYAIAGAIIAFIGLITSNIITNIITDIKNIKALQTIGYLLYFAAIIAIPTYLYKNYREDFYKYVFMKQVEVKAETQEEFIYKTLKSRYNLNFTCDNKNLQHFITEQSQRMISRICEDEFQNEFEVKTIAYNEGENQYILIDNYLDILYFNKIKKSISEEILKITNATEVKLSIYPETNCIFVGDCASCDEYYANFERENNPNNQYEASKKLNFAKYLSLSTNKFIEEYINQNNFKYIIIVSGNYANTATDYNQLINNILNSLSSHGLKNTYGYDIIINHYSTDGGVETEDKVFQVAGKTNESKLFNNHQIIDITK